MKATIPMALAATLVTVACGPRVPQKTSAPAQIEVILHGFYEPTMVSLRVGSREVFRKRVVSEGTTGVAASFSAVVRAGDAICVRYAETQRCRSATTLDLTKRFLLVSATPPSIKFVNDTLLD